ncbi:MAG: FAD-dependent oxidoreductase [Alphaproteobacteria bacterium]
MPVSVAIVGSGPSGYYTADALLKADLDVRIDVIERLPAPFGLIRYGVAPDHQTTKNVQRAFDKTAQSDGVGYYGNVEIGRDISVDELRSLYDAVVFAVGSPYDRKLGIPGEDKQGVLGSAEFVGWYNAHPDFRDLDPPLDTENVVVIGVGNVAIDIARVLVKTREEMQESDIVDYSLDAIQASPITDVYMLGRRGPVEAKFTNVELREMGKLENAVSIVDADQLPDGVVDDSLSDRDRRLKERNLATLKEFIAFKPDDKPKRVHFHFYATPVEILGGERVEAVKVERTKVENGRAVGTGEFYEIPCSLVLAAIGYQSMPLDGVPFDERGGVFANDDGRIANGVYAAGWVKRGPTGVIATNRPDGQNAAKLIAEDFAGGGTKPGREALEAALQAKGVRWVGYPDWLKLNEHEVGNARPGSPRAKVARVADMLAVIDGG